MMKTRMFALAVVAIFALGLPALAGQGYVGASYTDSSATFETLSDSFDTSSGGWKIFGGYDLIKYFGVEATYYDLGSFDDSSDISSVNADISVFDLSGRGILPLGKRFELFAKLGYSSVDVDIQTTDGFVSGSASGRDWELFYALGATLKLGERFGIRAEYEAWDVDPSLDAWSLGAVFRFGGQ